MLVKRVGSAGGGGNISYVFYNHDRGHDPHPSRYADVSMFALSWVETWQRKKRQFLCPDGDRRDCQYGAEDDLRDARCDNKSNNTVIEVLKTDLECGWASSAPSALPRQLIAVLPALLVTLFALV